MKKQLKKLALLLVAVPILLIGCKKSDIDNGSETDAAELKVTTPVYCGSTTTGILYDYFDSENTNHGTVIVGNDANNLYVTYTLAPGWSLLPSEIEYYNGCYLFVGSQSELETLGLGDNISGVDNTGHFLFLSFPYTYTPLASGETTYQFTIPRSEITVDCPMIVAFAGITNGVVNKYVSARSMFKGMGYWFTHCMQACNHETAYAYGNGASLQTKCFLNIPNITAKNWGWTNQIEQGTYNWPIYAGAGQCDITKGTLVGTLNVVYSGTTATITYNLLPGKSLDETHLWIGGDMLPKNNKGQYITAPGQFPYNGNPIIVNNLSGNIWIAAHSVVSW